jgi:hypothetical protein
VPGDFTGGSANPDATPEPLAEEAPAEEPVPAAETED